jgi:N-acetylglucosamine kinase
MFLCGVEGGATETVAFVIENTGANSASRIVARATGPGSNVWVIGEEECIKVLKALLEKVADEARCRTNAAADQRQHWFAAVGLALSGMDHRKDQERMERLLAEALPALAPCIAVCTDVVGSLFTASALGGLVCIAGTGSAAMATRLDAAPAPGTPFPREALKVTRAGGWGHLIGDEGSAFWIARRTIKLAYRLEDGVVKSGTEGLDSATAMRLIREHFGTDLRGDILPHLYTNFSKAKVAGLAKAVAREAEQGDALCLHILAKVGGCLGRMIEALARGHPEGRGGASRPLLITAVGSVWKSLPLFKEQLLKTLSDAGITGVVIQQLRERSAVGAAVWAAMVAGVPHGINYDELTEEMFRIPA